MTATVARTLAVIQPEADDPSDAGAGARAVVDTHGMNPEAVLPTWPASAKGSNTYMSSPANRSAWRRGSVCPRSVASAIDGALDLCRQLLIDESQRRRRRDKPVSVPADPMLAPDASSGRPVVAFSDIALYLQIREPRNGPSAERIPSPCFPGLGLFAHLRR